MKNLYFLIKYFFVVFVTFCCVIACEPTKNTLTSIQGKNIEITENDSEDTDISDFISPFQKHIRKEMSAVLAYNPQALVKETNQLNASIGNLMADVSYEMVNPIYFKRTGKNIDLVLLNWGGIRADLPQGDVTVGTVYNLMPFENKMVVLEVKGEKLNEMVQYLVKAKKPNPLSHQVKLHITKKGDIELFTINNKVINPEATYTIATSDYLMNGGDGMLFFQNPINVHETDYLIRNVLMDYFKKIDTVQAKKDDRFIFVGNE